MIQHNSLVCRLDSSILLYKSSCLHHESSVCNTAGWFCNMVGRCCNAAVPLWKRTCCFCHLKAKICYIAAKICIIEGWLAGRVSNIPGRLCIITNQFGKMTGRFSRWNGLRCPKKGMWCHFYRETQTWPPWQTSEFNPKRAPFNLFNQNLIYSNLLWPIFFKCYVWTAFVIFSNKKWTLSHFIISKKCRIKTREAKHHLWKKWRKQNC